MKHLFFSFITSLFLLTVLTAQNSMVSLKVVDEYNDPSPYALVELYDETEQLVDGAVTDEEGNVFLKKIPFGIYTLNIDQATYEIINEQVTINTRKQDLGTFTLKLKKELNEVIVRSETSKYKIEIDKRVIDVGQDLVSSGANASDVLNNIPSVSIDQQTGELSLRGNANVKVMIDGKPSNVPTAQLLKQLPSNSIKSIEIITNPSAKYDPEGNSGILNIITNKEKRMGYNIGVDAGITRGRRTRENASFTSNYNTGDFNFFANYSGNWGKNYFFGNFENETTGIDQFFGIDNNRPSNLVKVGFDYFIDDKTALTIYTNQNFANDNGEWDSEFYQFNETFKNFNDEVSKYHNQDYSLNFKRNFDRDNHYIELDGIFSISKDDDDRDFQVTYPVVESNPQLYTEFRKQDKNNARLNFDYHNVFKEKTTLEAGMQYRREYLKSNYLSSQEVSNPFNPEQIYSPFINYDFTRSIYSSYFNVKRKFGKWGTQVGLRFENVQENSENLFNNFDSDSESIHFKNDYNALYPSAFLTYTLGEKNTLSLNYSRRVDRPSVNQLSPVSQWNSGLVRSIGNPNLKPQFTNSFELGFIRNLKGGSLSANLFYRRVEDQIFRYITTDPEVPNGAIMQYINYNNTDAYGVEFNIYTKIRPWWTLNGGTDFFSNEIQFQDSTRRGTPFNARISQDFTILKKIKLQNFFMYRGKNVFAQGEMRSMWRMDLGARYNFAKNNASITARVNDIFNTFYAQAVLDTPYNSKGTFRWEAQTFYLGISYNFGGKVKSRNIKSKGAGSSNSGGGIGF